MPDTILADAMLLAMVVDMVAIPLVGLWALLAVKLNIGEPLHRAQRRFLVALVVISLVTLRTVTLMDSTWLIHTMTLASMVIGACVVPGRGEMVANP
ncbi:MAG: hypothetical protein AAFU85_32820 [Planctomycetota bacterium]